MLEKNSATSSYSFTVPMTTSNSTRSETGDDSSLGQSSRSILLSSSQSRSNETSSLKGRKSLYDVGQAMFASSRVDNQKVVTFYRESDSEKPELRIIIDARKYTNLEMLIDELSRILNLKDHERNIYNQSGRILRRLEDFEDGGSYFFSFSANDKRFMQALSVLNDDPKNPREKAKNNWKKVLNRKKRMINIITNENSSHPWKVLIDETKLQSFSQLLHELNLIIQPKDGRVFRLCTNKGRRVRGLGELFLGTNTFVAIVSSIGLVENGGLNGSFNEMKMISPRKQRLHKPTKYNVITGKGSHLERRLINIKGTCHVFHPPSNVTKEQLELQATSKAPEPKLQLDWVHGYNGQESRDNLFVLQSEELVYYVASVVVVYDVYRHQQRYYTEHTMKITCMALHPNNWYIATGQSAPENYNLEVVDHIRIWNAEMLNTLAVLTLEEQTLSVTRLAFSLEDYGRKIASIDTDGHNYRMLVWQWNSKDIVAKSQSYEEEDLSMKFHPHSNKSLLSVGKNHVFCWNWRGNILEKYKGHFFDCEVPEYVNCMVYASGGDAIAGDSNGSLQFWQDGSRKMKKVIKNAHMGGIQAMFLLSHDVLVTYGADDHLLSLWELRNEERTPTATIKVTEDHGTVTSIAVSPNHHDYNIGDIEFFLGTSKNQILHGTFKTQFIPLVKGHDKETTCVVANPCYNHILTIGLDGQVIYRSIESNSIMWEKKIEYPATSAAFYPYGNVVAVGMDSGRWCVLGTEDGSHIASFQSGRDPLTAMAYTIEGGDIAIATATGKIYLFAVYDEGHSYRLVANVECNSEAITAIDWSKDGSHLRTMTTEWDQSILNTEQLSEVGDLNVIADLNWQTQKTTLSYATSGIWAPASDLRFLSADRSSSRDLLCVGSEYGHVRLYTYPCWNKQANYREYSLHTGKVNKVCFLPSGIHLVSSGQDDNAVMQWRIAFGKAATAGWKTGFLREHTIEDHPEGWMTRERSSSVGHRKMRRSESSTRSSIDSDPFARPSSVGIKGTGVENIPDDYYYKKEKMSPQEIQDYLHRSGTGLSGRAIVSRKSKDFLHNYDVAGPVTMEQKQHRRRGRIAQSSQKDKK